MSNLSLADSKISEIIDALLLHHESEAPENYRELAEYLTKFKLQNSQNPLESIFSMINTFEINKELLKEETEDTSDLEDSEEFWCGEPEEIGGAYADDESFLAEFDDGLPDDEAEYLSFCYSLKYGEEYSSPFTTVERNVIFGLILQIKKEAACKEEFLTAMQDALQLVGFSTPQIWEIMTQHLPPVWA